MWGFNMLCGRSMWDIVVAMIPTKQKKIKYCSLICSLRMWVEGYTNHKSLWFKLIFTYYCNNCHNHAYWSIWTPPVSYLTNTSNINSRIIKNYVHRLLMFYYQCILCVKLYCKFQLCNYQHTLFSSVGKLTSCKVVADENFFLSSHFFYFSLIICEWARVLSDLFAAQIVY